MKSPLNILYLEDNIHDAELVTSMLEDEGFACLVTRVETEEAFLDALRTQTFDLIISDFSLPSFDGKSALYHARQIAPEIPFVFVSGTIGEDAAIESLLNGASDYVLKQKLTRLIPAVRRVLREAQTRREREVAEQRLRESESRYRKIFEATGTAMALVESDEIISLTNSVFQKLAGCSQKEIEGAMRFREFIHPDDLNKATALYYRLKNEGIATTHEFDFRFVGKDRVPKDVVINISRISETGTLVVSILDITKRLESEQEFRSLVESAHDAIFSLSPSGIITSLNPAFEKITGWKSHEWLGKSFTDLIHEDDFQKAVDDIRRLTAGEVLMPREIRIKRKDGAFAVGEFILAPLVRNNVLRGMFGIGRDVTERKRLEQELRQASKLESIGTLAGGIAHDFNNILGIIVGYISVLKNRQDEEHVEQALASIDTAARRGAGLVKQLLTFARKTEAKLARVHVNDVIKELIPFLQETFPKIILFTLQLDDTVKAVNVDVNQMHQVLLNLCVNARDAIPAGSGGRISVTTANADGKIVQQRFPQAGDVPYVAVTLSDTGAGMDEGTLAHLFEPFFTTKGIGQGTGLGLSVVYGVVKSCGGFIDVTSAPGKGTTFHLYLPTASEKESSGAGPVPAWKESAGGSETILFVEDEEMLRTLLRTLLEEKGYRVITAENGEDAIAIYADNFQHIDLILTDIGLPRVSGWDAFLKMREINPSARAILASGFVDNNQRAAMAKAGMTDIIQKPYAPDEVFGKIRSVLDRK
ncbi:MAG: PAS domain S-box protein [Bacteroidota bacterium]|nr:PAS domain S-box protein [Bacteroidota bacterium]